MSNSENQPDFWDCGDGERLQHDDIDDAIEDELDKLYDCSKTPKQNLEELPEEIEVYGFCRAEIDEQARQILVRSIMEMLMESLCGEYGDPDDTKDPPLGTEEWTRKLVDHVADRFDVWRCEQCCTRTTNVRKWIEENRPEWLEE